MRTELWASCTFLQVISFNNLALLLTTAKIPTSGNASRDYFLVVCWPPRVEKKFFRVSFIPAKLVLFYVTDILSVLPVLRSLPLGN